MAVTLVGQGSSTENLTSYTTASMTPTAGKLYLAAFLVSGPNPAADFTLAGWGLNWQEITKTAFVARGAKMFAAVGTPTAGALTITSVGAGHTSAAWVIAQADADTSGGTGLSAIKQSKASRPLGPPLVQPFDTTVQAGNPGFAMVAISLNETVTPGAGWTGLAASSTVTTPTSSFVGMMADSAPQNIEATWTTSDSAFVVGVEIKPPATGGGDTTAPTVPGSVEAVPDSHTQVTITWAPSTDAVGVTSYRVRRNGADLAGATALTTTRFVDSTVSPSTAYSYTVSARDAAGNRSPESPADTLTTPAAPVQVNSLFLGTTQITSVFRGTVAQDRVYLGGRIYEFSVPAPPPEEPPPGGGTVTSGILLNSTEIAALPTSGAGWDAIINRINSPYGGAYTLGVRDDSNKDVLANALAGARLNNTTYKNFVRDKISFMMAAPRNNDDVLGTLRHLQTYVIAADLINLAAYAPSVDATFRSFLEVEWKHDYAGGGGGGSIISTHDKKANNFATHAGAGRIAIALYLGDTAEYNRARDVWYGWTTGDPAYIPPTRTWSSTNWHFNSARKRGINEAGAVRDGHRFDGVIPEDQERATEYIPGTWPPAFTNYVHGAMDGCLLSFWMMGRRGDACWTWADSAARRQMEWKYEVGDFPYSGFRWQIPVVNKVYGTSFSGGDPAGTSTNMGYADWWAQ